MNIFYGINLDKELFTMSAGNLETVGINVESDLPIEGVLSPDTSSEICAVSSVRNDTRPYMTSIEDLTAYFAQGHGSFEGYTPASIVERDLYLPFKKERTDELVEDLKKTRDRDGWGNGQDSPMLAAYITGENKPSVEVYDGLHRQVANIVFQQKYGVEAYRPQDVRAAIGSTAIHFVTVKPMSRRDMLDKRLSNTHNHPELRFARGGLWSAQLWYLDDISSLAPQLSAKQAFQIAERSAKYGNQIGDRLGLNPEVVDQIAEWATERAESWSVDPSTIYKWILRAEATTPEIIAQVRNVGKGREAKGIISESMITSLASYMGGEQFHDIHTVVINFATQNNLNEIQFTNLLAQITSTPEISDATNTDQVLDFLEEIDVEALNAKKESRANRRIRRRTDIFSKGGAAVASVSDAIDRLSESLDVREERSYFIPDVDQRQAAIEAAQELERQAEKAWEIAARARQHALSVTEDEQRCDTGIVDEENAAISGPNTRLRREKKIGFGFISGMPVTQGATERREIRSTSELLHEVCEALPTIKNDALSGKWSSSELNDALEVATSIAELLALLSLKTQTKEV